MLAQEKAKTKERVLIISTDPAHVELLMICFKTATRNIFWMKFWFIFFLFDHDIPYDIYPKKCPFISKIEV